jgi:CheY-like chemotaxis protein
MLLRRALGERVELTIDVAEDLWSVKADPGQLEQVLVNLAVNARDAMPDGGRLMIEAENFELDRGYAEIHPGTEAGLYIRIKVSDTGTGMDAETVERAFEPFFTTKGEGTGLGLATVYGIVTGAGGRIDVYSEPGIGTTVKIHFPATEVAANEQALAASETRTDGNGKIVLVVEDEPDVRRTAERILGKGGFSVIGADDVIEALRICESDQRIDLMLTDVVMPEMTGSELSGRARDLRPQLKVLYMSGYSHEVLAPEALTEDRASDFIEKPFSARSLLETVHDLIAVGPDPGKSEGS